MLLKSKKMFNLTGISLLLCLWSSAYAQAGECGAVQYLENKSNGVEVTANNCKAKDSVAVGSQFNLMPGARLWVKSPSNSGNQKQYHAICQNRSVAAISIVLENAGAPWLSPKGLRNCSGWADNKLNCDGANGEKNALYCVVAEIDPVVYMAANTVERTTSVTMRGPKKITVGVEKEQIVTAMRPETELCRSVYQPDYPVKVEWIVDADGRVINVVPHSETSGEENAGDRDKRFVDCVVDVVKYFSYPKLSKYAFLSASF